MSSLEELLAGSGHGVRMAALDDGTEVVVKTGEPSAIAAEAAGLRWLAEPGVVAVPDVLATAEGRMVSTRVPTGRADPGAAERFGRDLVAAGADPERVVLLRSFDPEAPQGAEVPDPYYGGPGGFDEVIEMVEAAMPGLVERIR